MFIFAVRRIVTAIPVLLIATFITFWATSAVSNPLDRLATCQTCSQQAYDRLIDLYDLDQPIPQWYVN